MVNPVTLRASQWQQDAAQGKLTDKEKLEKSVREFEAYFVGYVFEQAHKAVPKSGFLGDGSHEDMFQSMFIQEIAKEGEKTSHGFGLAEAMLRQLSPQKSYEQIKQAQQSTIQMNGAQPDYHFDYETILDKKEDVQVTSMYGVRKDPLTGKDEMHQGIDIAAPIGSPIKAAQDGIVEFSGDRGGYGRTVLLSHQGDVKTLYAHLDEQLVKEGQAIKKGQVIGFTGNTGRSTGPHLHFEVRKDNEAIDPKLLMKNG